MQADEIDYASCCNIILSYYNIKDCQILLTFQGLTIVGTTIITALLANYNTKEKIFIYLLRAIDIVIYLYTYIKHTDTGSYVISLSMCVLL
jgi:hypothetical protein